MNSLSFFRENAPFLCAGFLLTFASSFGQTFFISVFAGDIQRSFDLSHTAWGGLYMIGTLSSAVLMIWAGTLTDTYRVRVLGKAIIVLLACACLSMAALPSVWFIPVAIFLLRFSGQGMLNHISSVAMTRWFQASRGKALSFASTGYAVGEATLPILFVLLLVHFDWRFLWVGSAVLTLCLLPVLARLLRMERTPQSIVQGSDSVGMHGKHWTRSDVIRHPLFWFIAPAVVGPSAWITAFFFQQVHFAKIKGWAHLELVTLFPIYTGVGVVAMILSGFVIDRFGSKRLMPIFLSPLIVGFWLFATADTVFEGTIAMGCLALASGANSTVPIAYWAETFGTQFIGSIKAMATALMVLGSAIGPGLSGFLIDQGVGFETQLKGFSIFFALACLSVAIGIAVSGRETPRST